MYWNQVHHEESRYVPPDMSASLATTRWSVIKSVDVSSSARRTALSELYHIYWAPICSHFKRLGVRQDEVEDVAQDFFLKFFDGGALERADRDRGRFRFYLLGALRFHASHHFRSLQKERLDHQGMDPSDSHGEQQARLWPTMAEAASREFDEDWAKAWFAQGLSRFTEELGRQGKDGVSETMQKLILGLDESSRHEVAAGMGITTGALASRVHRLRHRFREILREEAMRTVTDEKEAEAELRYLLSVLGTSWE